MDSDGNQPKGGVPPGMPEMDLGAIPDLKISGDAKSGCSVSCAEVHCGSPVMPIYECGSLTCPTLNIGDIKCGDVNIGSVYCSEVKPPEYRCEAMKCPEFKFPEYRCPAFSCSNLPPCPQCIDTSFSIVVMIIVLVSLIAILMLIYKLKKNRGQSLQNTSLTIGQQNTPAPFMATSMPYQNMPLMNGTTNQFEMARNLAKQNAPERMPHFVLLNQGTDNQNSNPS